MTGDTATCIIPDRAINPPIQDDGKSDRPQTLEDRFDDAREDLYWISHICDKDDELKLRDYARDLLDELQEKSDGFYKLASELKQKKKEAKEKKEAAKAMP